MTQFAVPRHVMCRWLDLGTDPDVELLRESADNIVYRVRGTVDGILRVSKRTEAKDLDFELAAVAHLARAGLPVPRVLPGSGNALFEPLADGRAAVLFERLPGDDHPAGTELRLDQIASAGRALADVHEEGRSFHCDSSRLRTAWSELDRAVENSAEIAAHYEGGTDFVAAVEAYARQTRTHRSQTGLCHGDFRPGNVRFGQDNCITGIIDWDWCYVGPQVSDLGLALVEWAFSDGASAPDQMAIAAFYRGYRSAFDTPPHRLDELLDWVRATCLASAGTFLCDALPAADRPASVRESFMFGKYEYMIEHPELVTALEPMTEEGKSRTTT